MHVGEHCINADAVTADVGFGPNLGVDRNQIGLSPNIKAESAEERSATVPLVILPVKAAIAFCIFCLLRFSLKSTSKSIRRNSSANVRASLVVVDSGVLASG